MLAKNVRGSRRWLGRTAKRRYTSVRLGFSKARVIFRKIRTGKVSWSISSAAGWQLGKPRHGEETVQCPPTRHSTWGSTDTRGTFSSAFAPHASARVQISDIHTGALRPMPGGPLGPAHRSFPISLFVVVRTGQTTFWLTNNTRGPWTETYWWMFFVVLKKRTILRWNSSYRGKKRLLNKPAKHILKYL